MLVEITSAERKVLVDLVEHRIEDLGPEIRRCQSFPYQEELKEERKNWEVLLSRLRMRRGGCRRAVKRLMLAAVSTLAGCRTPYSSRFA